MEAFLGEGASVEDGLYGCRRGGREDLGGERDVSEVVERETGAMRTQIAASIFGDGSEMPASDAGFEDEVLVGFGDTMAVVDDDESTIAAGSQG